MKRYVVRLIARTGALFDIVTADMPDDYTKEQALTAVLQPLELQKNADWLRSGDMAVQVKEITAIVVMEEDDPRRVLAAMPAQGATA